MNFFPRMNTAIPAAIGQQLRRAALQRNLRTAAVLAAAASGGPFGMTWLAATAGTTFLALSVWRMRQLGAPHP